MLVTLLAGAVALSASGLTPIGPWQVGTENQGCRADRPYGGSPATIASLQNGVNQSDTEISITSDSRLLPEGSGATKLKLGPTGQAVEVKFETSRQGDRFSSSTKISGNPAMIEMIFRASDWEIGRLNIRVTSVHSVVQALQACKNALLASWNLDPTLYAGSEHPVIIGSALALFEPESYPPEAIHKHLEGRVVLVLSVDQAGHVSACRAAVSPDPILAQGSCKLAIRARVNRARNEASTSKLRYFFFPINWRFRGQG